MPGSQDAKWVNEILEFSPGFPWFGKILRVGDKVDHTPPRIDPRDPPEAAQSMANCRVRRAIEYYGEGPFDVRNICIWPCGRVMIYIDSPANARVRGSGVYLRDMVKIEEGGSDAKVA